MINLHESMGQGRDCTRGPWICSQTRICCQTLYRLRYTAQYQYTVKPVLSGYSKIDKTKVLMTDGSLMEVQSIAILLTFIKR